MKELILKIDRIFCWDCVKASRDFLRKFKGIEEVEVADEGIKVIFNPDEISEHEVRKLTIDTLERLGYKIIL